MPQDFALLARDFLAWALPASNADRIPTQQDFRTYHGPAFNRLHKLQVLVYTE